ncbi:hypothetical protein CLCR_01341 [Cladophialophora carrionii]|uniref:Uncharacterized protein n=1 Tax=Cladophialophora carrionii TaxID=86049 RepID=A0A1C1CCX4_9EURO|nr:hypothetical protein CLCR_01341 [Cladophialophora carrionii]
MKLNKTSSVAAVLSVLSFNSVVSAIATLTVCTVVGDASVPSSSFQGGNLFTIHIENVPDVSESTICGHSDSDIHSAADSFSTRVTSVIACSTSRVGNDQNFMDLNVRFDKQSPSVQLSALQNGITAAFGSQGVDFDASKCDISGIPS